jgi:lysozyme
MPSKNTGQAGKTFRGRKNATGKKILIAIVFSVALLVSGGLLIDYLIERRAGFIRYPGFGISMPSNFSVHGIDVSHHQGYIAWDAVRKMSEGPVKISFVFIKATEGVSLRDPRFNRNWKGSREQGLKRGAYHYFLADKNPQRQAAHFIETVKLEKNDLPPVLDVEETRGVQPAVIRKRVREWLQIVERHYGVKPIIYANPTFYSNILGREFNDHQLWVAHYVRRHRPRIGREWKIWQFSESARVNGIRSKVDFNVFNGDSLEFRKLLLR